MIGVIRQGVYEGRDEKYSMVEEANAGGVLHHKRLNYPQSIRRRGQEVKRRRRRDSTRR
jgi:hypothetical protein